MSTSSCSVVSDRNRGPTARGKASQNSRASQLPPAALPGGIGASPPHPEMLVSQEVRTETSARPFQ